MAYLNLSLLLSALVLVALCLIFYRRMRGPLRVAPAALLLALSVVVGTHRWPGFPYWPIVSPQALTACSTSFRWTVYLDKFLLALVMACFLGRVWRDRRSTCSMPRLSAMTFMGVAAVLALAWAFDFIRWQPVWPDFWMPWLFANLLLVVVPEEILFRGFIQRELESAWSRHRHGASAAMAAGALIFGAAHLGGGVLYALLVSTAGLFYGLLWRASGSLLWPIFGHFLVNAVHFTLFTYPAWNGRACA